MNYLDADFNDLWKEILTIDLDLYTHDVVFIDMSSMSMFKPSNYEIVSGVVINHLLPQEHILSESLVDRIFIDLILNFAVKEQGYGSAKCLLAYEEIQNKYLEKTGTDNFLIPRNKELLEYMDLILNYIRDRLFSYVLLINDIDTVYDKNAPKLFGLTGEIEVSMHDFDSKLTIPLHIYGRR